MCRKAVGVKTVIRQRCCVDGPPKNIGFIMTVNTRPAPFRKNPPGNLEPGADVPRQA